MNLFRQLITSNKGVVTIDTDDQRIINHFNNPSNYADVVLNMFNTDRFYDEFFNGWDDLTILDIGGNIGLFSLYIQDKAKAGVGIGARQVERVAVRHGVDHHLALAIASDNFGVLDRLSGVAQIQSADRINRSGGLDAIDPQIAIDRGHARRSVGQHQRFGNLIIRGVQPLNQHGHVGV